jgi:hypothetical protein
VKDTVITFSPPSAVEVVVCTTFEIPTPVAPVGPCGPVSPLGPCEPVAPVSPLGP